MTASSEAPDRIDAADATEPIEKTDPADPIEPTDSTEPTEPTDRIEPRDPMLRSESLDLIDQREPWASLTGSSWHHQAIWAHPRRHRGRRLPALTVR